MNPVTGLSLGRIAIGAVALARPELATRLFQLDGRTNAQLPFALRIFGSREVALGAATLLSSGRARTGLVLAGAAVDAADAAAGYLGMQDKTLSTRTAAPFMGVAAGAVIAGLLGLGTKSKKPKRSLRRKASATA